MLLWDSEMSSAGKNRKNNPSKKPYLILALSLSVLFIWLGGVLATPYQASFSHSPKANPQALPEIDGSFVTASLAVENVWSDNVGADSQQGESLFPITPASANAYAGLSKNDLRRETSASTATPEPPSMLLFASALIGLASIGRKRLFKK